MDYCSIRGLTPRSHILAVHVAGLETIRSSSLDGSRIRTLGWRPKLSIQEGILRTLRYLQENPWVLDRRS